MVCFVLGDSLTFLSVLVTVFALCILTDRSNFLLRYIVVLLRKPLLNILDSHTSKMSGKSLTISIYKIISRKFLYDREYSGKLITLLGNSFPQFLCATLYVLLYAITIFILNEFHSWIILDSEELFRSMLSLYTLLSSAYWVCVWLHFCYTFKRGLKEMAMKILDDVISYSNDNSFKPKEIFNDTNLHGFSGIFLSILFLSWLFVVKFPDLCGFLHTCNTETVSHFAILFIILNGFIVPVILTWFMCCFTNISFRKKKWKQHLTLLTSLFRKKK